MCKSIRKLTIFTLKLRMVVKHVYCWFSIFQLKGSGLYYGLIPLKR